MIVLLILNRNKERGKELKIPYYARAILTRDGNMPCVMATCLIPDSLVSSKLIIDIIFSVYTTPLTLGL